MVGLLAVLSQKNSEQIESGVVQCTARLDVAVAQVLRQRVPLGGALVC